MEAIESIVAEAAGSADVTQPETEIDPALLRDDSLLD